MKTNTVSPFPVLRALLLLMVSVSLLFGCGTIKKKSPTPEAQVPEAAEPPAEPDVESCLAEAAARFQFPDAPPAITLLDIAKVEYLKDGGFRVESRSMWAARTQPKSFPPPLHYNASLQKLSDLKVRTWTLSKDGRYELDGEVTIQPTPILENAPTGLEAMKKVEFPALKAGKAMEVCYTLENLRVAPVSVVPGAPTGASHGAERAFAFRWQGEWPALKRELVLSHPVSLKLYGLQTRVPSNVKVYEKTASQRTETTWVLDGWQPGVPFETAQPPLADLTGVSAFTPAPDWETALTPFRSDCEKALEEVKGISWPITDSEGNTPTAFSREEQARLLVNRLRSQWTFVSSGLPVFHQARRPLTEALTSKVLTPREAALVLAASLQIVGIQPKVLLARRAPNGALLTQSPSLSQFDEVLVGWGSDKDFTWVDPSEPLAAAGNLPLALLDVHALESTKPVKWRVTPGLLARDHRKERNVELDIRADGTLHCRVELNAFGSSEVALRQFFRATTDASRRESVSRGLSRRFPNAKLLDYKGTDYRDLSQPLLVTYDFEVPDFLSRDRQGRALFYPPVFEDVEDFLSSLRDDRRQAIALPQNFNSTVRQIIRYPKGWACKELPSTGTLSNSVAEFLAEPKIQFGTLIYERYTGIKKRTIAPGAEYKQLLAFYQAVLKQDRTPFTLTPGGAPKTPARKPVQPRRKAPRR